MFTIKKKFTGALAAAPLLASLLLATAAQAASIAGDSFMLGMSYSDSSAEVITLGPILGVASAAPGAVFSSIEADAAGSFDVNGGTLNLHALWVDTDTVHLFLQGDDVLLENLSINLTDLNFMGGSTPAAIVAANFNGDGGGGGAFSGFDEVISGKTPYPTISFTGSSVSLFFSTFTGRLVADGPTMEINLVARAAAAAPEPESLGLMLGGLAVVGFMAHRKQAL
jgi:hypothetical protein